jgi:hypothetical protein
VGRMAMRVGRPSRLPVPEHPTLLRLHSALIERDAPKTNPRRRSAPFPIALNWEGWARNSVLQQGAKRAILGFVLDAQTVVFQAQNLVLHVQIGLARGV